MSLTHSSRLFLVYPLAAVLSPQCSDFAVPGTGALSSLFLRLLTSLKASLGCRIPTGSTHLSGCRHPGGPSCSELRLLQHLLLTVVSSVPTRVESVLNRASLPT